jgi:integrase/recombinase XerD
VKIDRNGKARALTDLELDRLLAAAPSSRYRALWAIQRWTAARISEALALRWADVNGCLSYRAATTKSGMTRQVPIAASLRVELTTYREAWAAEHGHAPAPGEALFPAMGSTTTPQTRQAADKALRQTCARLGLVGVSTHSFRRSLAQAAVSRGVPLHVVQAVTGHKSLGSLGEYLAATEAEVLAAIGGESPWQAPI